MENNSAAFNASAKLELSLLKIIKTEMTLNSQRAALTFRYSYWSSAHSFNGNVRFLVRVLPEDVILRRGRLRPFQSMHYTAVQDAPVNLQGAEPELSVHFAIPGERGRLRNN